MPIITPDLEAKLLNLLVQEGLIDHNRVTILQTEASGKSLIDRLQEENSLDEQTLAHATAALFGVPFVFLQNRLQDHRRTVPGLYRNSHDDPPAPGGRP